MKVEFEQGHPLAMTCVDLNRTYLFRLAFGVSGEVFTMAFGAHK
jgi:hypothetical protein